MELTPARDTLAALEATIERGLTTFVEVGQALLEIREGRLYRETHDSFEGYCRDRWGLSRPRAYELIQAAEVVGLVSGMPDTEPPANARQASELARLKDDPEAVREVWSDVQEATGGKPTAADVRQVVDRRLGVQRPSPRRAPDPTFTDDYREDVNQEAWPPDPPTRPPQLVFTPIADPEIVHRCETCGEPFDAQVWHCTSCGHHWPWSDQECGNCHADRPGLDAVDDATNSEPEDEDDLSGLPALPEAGGDRPSTTITLRANQRIADAQLRAWILKRNHSLSEMIAIDPGRARQVLPPDDMHAVLRTLSRAGSWCDQFEAATSNALRILEGDQ